MASLCLKILKLHLCSIALLTIISMLASQANGVCCSPKNFVEIWQGRGHYMCDDGKKGTPCCGNSGCNFFCCNCGDGCRMQRTKREVGLLGISEGRHTGFQKIDRNGDGFVDKHEAHHHLLAGGCGNYKRKMPAFHEIFDRMDKDGDGKLSYSEIDSAE